jgi:hypothetical protein
MHVCSHLMSVTHSPYLNNMIRANNYRLWGYKGPVDIMVVAGGIYLHV